MAQIMIEELITVRSTTSWKTLLQSLWQNEKKKMM